jgi:hypothetical protein
MDDPVLVVPWTAEPGTADTGMGEFVDLRENPYDLDRIPEAEQHPPLMQALRALNAPRSPVFTAKCDAWVMGTAELAALRVELDLAEIEAPCGFASYIDLLWRERTLFVSFHQQEQRLVRLVRLVRLARLADGLEEPYAAVECVLRPALVDLTELQPHEGFAVSLYVKALGTDASHAYEHWGLALEAVVTLLRGKEFSAG